jgi:phage terminase Nu1 subunit (DNA packaging protein)
MMLPKSVTSKELYELTGYSKAAIIKFEQDGLIARSNKNDWPLETLTKLFTHLRERKPLVSEERVRFEKARADRERLRVMRESKEVVPASDLEAMLYFFTGKLLPFLGGLPARIAGQDMEVRRRAEAIVRDGQQQMADACKAEADRLLGKDGKAA